MNWLIWNIRGFNFPLKQKEVKVKVKKLNVNLVCLVETRVREEKIGEIMNSFLPRWKFCFFISQHGLGRIWVMWTEDMFSIQICQIIPQAIHCKILFRDKMCYSSFIYGANKGVERNVLWDNLVQFCRQVRGFPWILAGDFNVIRNANEKLDCLTVGCYENEFNSCLDKLEVWDHAAVGCFYTWSNRQSKEEFVAKKLD